MQEIHTGTVSGMAFGGQGIVREEGLVTFIPFAATGDTLTYRTVQKKKNFATGAIVDIIEPSALRTAPQCPYFGTCGGCQIQHIIYPAQLDCKGQWIKDALQRQAKLVDMEVPEVIPAAQQWQYRRRIAMTLRPRGRGYVAGYIGADGSSLIQVKSCPIFSHNDDPVFQHLQEIAERLEPADASEGKATLMKTDDGRFLLHLHFKGLPANAGQIIEKAKERFSAFKGIVATAPKRTLRAGSFETTLQIEGLTLEFSPQAFIQSHPEQSLRIYRELVETVEKVNPKTILDLYSGIGISSLLLARPGRRIVGVEANGEAVRLASENSKRNGISGVKFHQGYVEEVLPPLLSKETPDVIIVNPPREGLAPEAVKILVENPAKTLIYISCMPSTLARDLKILCEGPYKVQKVQGYDMFPQTTHVETMTILVP